MKLKSIFFCCSMACSSAFAQSSTVDINDGSAEFLNRIEALSGSFSDSLFLTQQPLTRKDVADHIESAQRGNFTTGWSNIDNTLMRNYLSKNGEWASPDGDGALNSRTPILGLYKKQTDFIYHNKNGFFISVNPILGYQGLYETDLDSVNFKNNFTAGLALRTTYKNIVGATLNLKYISEQPVSYIREYFDQRNTVIGSATFNRKDTNTFTYFLPTGQLSAALIKNHISAAVGYDYQKIGDGYRALFISDYSAPVLFGKITTKIWKLQYENLYMRLDADQRIPGNELTNYSGGYKYATAHHLSVNVTPWLNMGLFEMVVFNRNNHFEAGYLNPIILYRAVERSLGSPDKVAMGINAKALPFKGFMAYGQFLLNEFSAKEFFASNGYMHNKWGAQLGFKYFDAFTLPNLNLQAEMNLLRPYTFQHYEKNGIIASNFTHNNLPLSHPLGAGFREFIGIASYRPLADLELRAKVMYYQQGKDTADVNFGNDLSKSYSANAPSVYGVKMVHGPIATGLVFDFNASYEFRPNLYLDLGGVYRQFDWASSTPVQQQNMYVYFGFRLNLARRDYAAFF